MPRYHFNVIGGDGGNLVSDPEGAVFSNVRTARKRAAKLARDIVRHGAARESIDEWKIVITGESEDRIVTVPFSEISGRDFWIRFHARELTARLKGLVAGNPSDRFAATAGLGVAIQGALIAIFMIVSHGTTYQTASSPAGQRVLLVRFTPSASPEAVRDFLDRYQALVIGAAQAGGFYWLHVAKARSPDELAATASRIMKEAIVEMAATAE
jgi:Domain of unknown function (DUF6894)